MLVVYRDLLREWSLAFEAQGLTARRGFLLLVANIVIVWIIAWGLDQVVPYGALPAVAILVRGLAILGISIVTGCALINAVIRRLRDAGVPLMVPATCFVLVCFAYVFDMLHILSIQWYGMDFWSGAGLSKGLEYMLQFSILGCFAATCGGLSLRSRPLDIPV